MCVRHEILPDFYFLRSNTRGCTNSVHDLLSFHYDQDNKAGFTLYERFTLNEMDMCNIIRIRSIERTQILFMFVCYVALRPKSTAMVIAGRSVHLTTLFPGQA